MPELRKELKDRGITLPASAKKSDLLAKLTEVLGSAAPLPPVPPTEPLTTDPPPSKATPAAAAAAVVVPEAAAAAAPASVTSAAPAPPAYSSGSSESSTSGSGTPATAANGSATSEATTPKAPTVTAVTLKAGAGGDKLAARAARFGGSISSNPAPVASIGSSEQLTALKKRAERFGEVVSDAVRGLELKEKLNKRADRFKLTEDEVNPTTKLGLVRKISPSSASIESGKRPALSSEDEERLRKRRERFGLT